MADLKERIDRLLCEFIDPDVAYEDQSAPLLDSSWFYTQRILQVVREEIKKHQLTDKEIDEVDEPCLRDEPCPFGIADEPCDSEGNTDNRCALCREREIAITQIQSILKALGGQ